MSDNWDIAFIEAIWYIVRVAGANKPIWETFAATGHARCTQSTGLTLAEKNVGTAKYHYLEEL